MPDKKLFELFPPASKELWVKQVVADLKGKNFDELLTYTTLDGIHVSPFYTNVDVQQHAVYGPLFSHTDWDICAEIDGTNEESGNKQFLHALQTGASSVICYVYAQVNLQQLCDGVQLQHIRTQFVIEGNVNTFITSLNAYLASTAIDRKSVSLNIDPVEQLLRTGTWRTHEEADRNELAQVMAWNGVLCINGNIYQQAGSPPAYELGCLLAHVNMLLQPLEEQQLLPKVVQLNIAIGPDYFFEIAKLRALRKVFALLFKEYGVETELLIHAETSSINMTLFDEYNNLLRTTTAAMAAAVGGCNSLFVKSFNVLHQPGNQESERLARNIQLILKEESHLNKMADVSAGSYFIEYLTEQLAQKAWMNFTSIEKNGGFFANLKQGAIQQQIADFAAQQQHAFNEGKIILVGSNKFPNLKEEMDSNKGKFHQPVPNKNAIIPQLFPLRLSAAYEQERLNQTGSQH